MSVVFRLEGNVKEDRVQEILSTIEAAGLRPKRGLSLRAAAPASVYFVPDGGDQELERVKGLIESVAPGALEYVEVPPPCRHLA